MFLGRVTVIESEGLTFDVQSAEIVEGWLSLRIRSAALEPVGHHGVQAPVLSGEQFTISDHQGNALVSSLVQSSSGPLLGVIDIAFPRERELDLNGPLALRCRSANATFTLSQ